MAEASQSLCFLLTWRSPKVAESGRPKDVEVKALEAWSRWEDWLSYILGGWMSISPVIFGAAVGSTASYVVLSLGAAILEAALYALIVPESEAAKWVLVGLGVILFLCPWLFGFASLTGLAWNARIVGVVVAGVSYWARSEIHSESDRLAHQHSARESSRPAAVRERSLSIDARKAI